MLELLALVLFVIAGTLGVLAALGWWVAWDWYREVRELRAQALRIQRTRLCEDCRINVRAASASGPAREEP